MRIVYSLLVLMLLSSCRAQESKTLASGKDDNTLLWEVRGNGLDHPSYLFGTFHLMCKNDIRFSDNLKAALSVTERVYMEMKMDDPAVLLGGLFMMNMKDGKTLADLYTPEEYKRLISFFNDSLHTPISMFLKAKPFFLEALLYPKMMPCKNVSGVEEELMKIAKLQKKEIFGLETIEFQTSVFDSIPYKDQAKELLTSIDSIRSYQKYFDTMMTVYKRQQLTRFESLFSKSAFGMDSHQDLLLDNRNKNWVGQLKKIMQEHPVFVAVGAGHLVGQKGLIELLRKEGYKVRGIMNN